MMMCSSVVSLVAHARDRRIERCVDKDDAVCAVIDDEGELFWEEADVERVNHGSH